MEGRWAAWAIHDKNNNLNLVMRTGDLFVQVNEGLVKQSSILPASCQIISSRIYS